jgi:flagellar biosynthesis protein FlhA
MATTTRAPRQGAAGNAGGGSVLGKVKQYADVAAASGIVAVVAMLIFPMPEWLLDTGIVLNLSAAILILLVAFYTTEPLQFSVFPPLLLVTTLFRLALNVSAMKLILKDGHAGHMIDAFGKVVIGGDVVVGVIAFLILIVIQFVVITKGAERVAEVAARFTLDAMPGRQMAIDADMNAGLITEDVARARRQAVQREADFYGSMDGASKFVRGDAIAAIIIIVINILGGFALGMMRGEGDFVAILNKYTLLTIGEGLVSQIPALLISTATALMVTRASSDENLGVDMAGQFLHGPRPLWIGGTLVGLFAFAPGFPRFQLIFVAAAMYGVAFLLRRAEPAGGRTAAGAAGAAAADGAGAGAAAAPSSDPAQNAGTPENVLRDLGVDAVELEIGYGLMPLVDASGGGDLLERITGLRRQIAQELGLVLPSIRIRDNLALRPSEYRIKIKGAPIAGGDLMTGHLLLMDPGTVMDPLPGVETRDPAFGLPALWVPRRERERAELAGYTVVDPTAVLITHLTEVLRLHAADVLTRQDVQALLDHLKTTNAAVVAEVGNERVSVGDIQKVLQHLLRERVSIRDLGTILETVSDNAGRTRDPDTLGELARAALARSICRQWAGDDGALEALTLDPLLEQRLRDAVQETAVGAQLVMEPGEARRVLDAIAQGAERMTALGQMPVLICASAVRLPLKRLLERTLPSLAVLAYNEIAPRLDVRAVGQVRVEEALMAAAA